MGLFDDLVPDKKAAPAGKTGLFADLVPGKPAAPGVTYDANGAPDYSSALNASEGGLGQSLMRGIFGRGPDIVANMIEMPATANEAIIRATGATPSDTGIGAGMRGLLRKGAGAIRDIGYSKDMDAVGYGAPRVSGGDVVEAINPVSGMGLGERLSTVGTFVPETLAGSVMDMAATVNPLTLGGYVTSRTNEIAKNRAANDPDAKLSDLITGAAPSTPRDVTLTDIAVAAPAAAVEALLERFTTMRLLPQGTTLATPGAREAVVKIAKELGLQAGIGGTEEVVPYLAETAGTETGATARGALESFAGGALAEGALGGAVETSRALSGRLAPTAAPETALSEETLAAGTTFADLIPARAAPVVPAAVEATPVASPEAPVLGDNVAPADPDAAFRRPVAEVLPVEAAVGPEIAPQPVSEPADTRPAAERLYADYNPEVSQTVTRKDGALSFPENQLTRRALDEAMADTEDGAGTLLRNLSEQPDIRPEQKWLAEKLAPLMKPLGVKLVEPNPDMPYAGAYNNVDNTVWARQADPETVLHETFHGVTSALITNKAARSNPVVGKAVGELDSMLGHLQAGMGMGEIDTSRADPEIRRLLADRQGPLSNTKEFVTYGLTNRPFQDFLRTLPPPPGRTEARNMWEYFKQAVASMFGKLTPQQRTFLDALIETGGDLTDFAAANPAVVRQAQVAEAAKLRPVENMGVVPPVRAEAAAPPPAAPVARPAPETAPARPPTSTKNAFVEGDREARGKTAVERDAPRSNETTLEMAKAATADNPDLPAELIARLSVSGVASINSVEEAALMVESERLRAERDRQAERASDPELSEAARAVARQKFDENEAAIDAIDQATVNSGREWGRFGQMRQRALKADYSLAALERKARAVKGEPLTREESAELKKMAADIAEKQALLEAQQKKLEAYETGAAVSSTYKKLLEDMRASTRVKADLPALKKKADAARAALRELAGTDAAVMVDAATLSPEQALIDLGAYHYANGAQNLEKWTAAMEADVPAQFREGLADLFELSRLGAAKPVLDGDLTHKQVYDLAMAVVKSGVKGEDAVMAAVTAEVQKTHPKITEREVRRLFSEYGKAYFPSKDADKTALRELRALVQMQESIDRLTEGLPKLKNGLQRDKATANVIAKRAQLNEMLKVQVKKATEAERKAALEKARIENLRAQIELIDRQVMTGERTAKAEAKPVSAEVARLSGLRDQLKKEQRAIDNPPKSEQQKREEARVRGLESSIQEMRDTLSGKPSDPAKPPVTSDQIKTLEKLRDELRAQLDAAAAAKNPPMSDAEKQQRRIESGLKRRIKNVEELLLFGKKPKQTPAEKGEAALLLESALQAFTDIRDAIELRDNPPLTPDQRYQKSRATGIANELKKVQARIAAGDYEKAVRIPKTLDEANTKAAYELQQAKEVFLRRQFEAEMAKRSPLRKVLGGVQESLNLARAIMTSFDLSAVLRQGGFISLGNPVRAAKGIGPMLKAFASKEGEFKVKHDIETRPNAALYKQAGLELTDTGSGLNLSKLEEAFMSRWIESVPKAVGGGFLRGSQRAFTTYLNKLRADSFDAMLAALARNGTDPTLVEAKAIASYINVATGRGKIGLSATAATGLNTVFFAPKLVASRFNLLAGQPLYGGTMRTRRLVLQEYARFLMGVGVVIGLGALAADPEDDEKPFIGVDPRSTDFLKMRFGKTYIDPMAGISQVTVFLGREISGETLTGSGNVMPLRKRYRVANLWRDEPLTDEPTFGGQTAYDVAARFVRTKLAPIPGAIVNLFEGTNVVGDEMTPGDTVTSLVVPLSMQNVQDVMTEHGIPAGMAITTLELLGMGVQYRDPAQLKAPDYDAMSRDEKNAYSAYVAESQKIKKAKTDLQTFANELDPGMAPGDVKYEVEKKAEELGLDGATVDLYKRNTTARDKETGVRMRGVKRTEAGNVKMNYKEAWSLKGFSAAEKSVSELDGYIEELDDDSVTNEEANKIWGKFVYSAPLNEGDPAATVSEKDKTELLKILRLQRKMSQDFLKESASE